MKKFSLIILITLIKIPVFSVNYFDANIGYTGSIGIQGQVTDKIIADNGGDYTAPGYSKNYVWDGVRFSQDSGGNLSLDNNIDYVGNFEHKHWQNILFDNTTTGNQRDVILDSESLLNGSGQRVLRTQNLVLRDTNLSIEGGSNLNFFDSTYNSLTLENSSLTTLLGDIQINSSSEFDLISKSGNNKLTAINGDTISGKINLDIQSNSKLEFSNSGSLAFNRPVLIGDSIRGTIDGGTLKLTSSTLKFVTKPDEFVFQNNSTLELSGTQSKIEITNSTFKNSEIILGIDTQFEGDTLKFEDSTLSMDWASKLTLSDLIVSGTSGVDGNSTNNTQFDTTLIQLNSGATFNTSGLYKIDTNVLKMEGTNNILNIDNNIFNVDTALYIDDGTINVKDSSIFVFNGSLQNSDMKLKLNIDNGGEFVVPKLAAFFLNNYDYTGTNNDYTTITNEGDIYISGTFSGAGNILGSGSIHIQSGAFFIPDHVYHQNTANLKINNNLVFEGGTYYSDINLDSNGNELSDKVYYVDKDVDISKGIVISTVYRGTPGRSAMDFHDKEFTVLQSDTTSSTGDIIGDYGMITVVKSADLPALLDFQVTDGQANGNKDITLIGEVQGVYTLAKHPSIKPQKETLPVVDIKPTTKPKPNAQQVVNILPSTTGEGSNQPVTEGAKKLQSALLTMTNSQVADNLNSLHAEPYSSHLTVGLEQNDLFLNMVMDHAVPRGDVYHSRSEKSSREVVPQTKNNIWVDTAYVSGDVDGEDGLGDFSYRLTNVLVGGDIYEKDYLILGIYGGYGYHKMDEHDSVTQEFETDTYHLGTYGSYRYNNWVFTGMFGYSYGKNETKRDVTVGTSSGTSGDKFDSHSFYTGVRAAYPIKVTRNTTLTPNAGMSYSYIYQEEVKESGFDMADLVVDSADADSFITSLGLHLEYEDAISGTPIRPMAFVRYEHDWSANNDSSHTVDAAFRHTPNNKTSFSGQNRGENLILVGTGIDVEATPSLLIGVGFTYSDDSNGRERGAGFNFEYLW